MQHQPSRVDDSPQRLGGIGLGIELRLQRIGVWCGPVGMLLYGVFYAGVGRLFPPLSPTSSAEEIAQFFVDHKIWVRIGIAGALLFAALMMPFLATIVLRVKRVEGRWGMLTMVQLFGATIFTLPMLFSPFLAAAAAYRPEQRLAQITQTLNDLFWMSIIALVGPFILQNIALAIASFVETTNPPVFTRWYGYFNLWVALLSLPSGALVLFNDGPLAWNGVFAFYVSVAATFVWIVVTTVVLLRGITAEQRAEQSALTAA